jgi:anaerobic ribonucleoside-triphosphate reductase activating protein
MPFTPLNEEDLRYPARIAQIVPCTRAEGPGKRFAVWFQGCPFRCPGCCNPEMLSFEGGQKTTVGEVLNQLQEASLKNADLEGITLLGGEPFAHAAAAGKISRAARSLNLSVMIFSGYLLEEIQEDPEEAVRELLANCDLLVDGLYDQNQPDTDRRWIGSANQRIHFLSDRYSADDPCWREPDTLEIRLENQRVTINGYPAKSAVGLWQRPGSKSVRLDGR